VFWRHPPYRHLVQRLARRFTVVRWVRPGFGLSDRPGMDLSPTGELALVERLVTFLGADQVTILAGGDAGPSMVRFAADHPECVSRLALFGTAADGRELVPALPDTALALMAGASLPAIHEVVAASQAAGSEPEVGSWLAAALVASADIPAMVELVATAAQTEAGLAASSVRAPTLVLHRAGDLVVRPSLGRALAARIPEAEFVTLEGSPHLLYAGDTDALLAALVPFFADDGASEPAPLSQRELEVAQMVTLGLTNAEIGHRLAIRRRTVDAHLEHIRAKLGVHSRTRIAAWAVRNRPTGGIHRGS